MYSVRLPIYGIGLHPISLIIVLTPPTPYSDSGFLHKPIYD